MLTLYQFTSSHFCEKARWALDHKGIGFTRHNLVPVLHLPRVRRMAPRSSVPVLVHDGTVVQGSGEIIAYLDRHWPARPLTPLGERRRQAALAWEEFLDRDIGVPLRCLFFHEILPRRDLAMSLLLRGAPNPGRVVYSLGFPLIRALMRRAMDIDAQSARRAQQRVEQALERLDGELRGRRFLVGDTFSRADLTAAALLAPLCQPPEMEYPWPDPLPGPLQGLRRRYRDETFFRWVLGLYRDHRGPGPAQEEAA